MPQTIHLWQIQDGNLTEVPSATLAAEEQLEDWLEEDISILSDSLLVIGRQVNTDFGGALDLLCINEVGDLVVVELKRDKTPRQVVAQALDYASWVVDQSGEDVVEQAERYSRKSLEDTFREAFGSGLPDVLNESHRILIVGSRIDARSERIIDYLSEVHGVNINAATFQVHRSEETGELLSRVFLMDPTQVDVRSRRQGTSKRKPNLTEQELEHLAIEQGVGTWYRALLDELESFFHVTTSRSSLVFKKDLTNTQFDVRRGTVWSLWPDPTRWPDHRQDREDGLYFQLYTLRVAEAFGVEEGDIWDLLPEDHDEWQYSYEEVEGEYSGADGFFHNVEEVERFTEGLKEIISKQN